MAEIIPAIMPENIHDIGEKLGLVRGAVSYVQIDVMDGIFVPNFNWPYLSRGKISTGIEEIPFWQDFNYEFDLMVKNPEHVLGAFVEMGATRIVFHYESADRKELDSAIAEAKSFDIEVGLAIDNKTDVSAIDSYIGRIDFVQIMGIEHPGFQGSHFDWRSIEKIKQLRGKYPNLIISVDGSVNDETAPLLIEAGANRLVSGSYIFDSGDAKGAISELSSF